MTGRTSEPEDPEALLASFAPRVYGLLLRLVGRPDVAEDLMQETMLRAYRSFGTYRPEGKFQAWIFRIAVNLARDWIRRRRREPSVSIEAEGSRRRRRIQSRARFTAMRKIHARNFPSGRYVSKLR